MRDVVIVSAVRTPVGKFMGGLSELSAVELGAIAVEDIAEIVALLATQADQSFISEVLVRPTLKK